MPTDKPNISKSKNNSNKNINFSRYSSYLNTLLDDADAVKTEIAEYYGFNKKDGTIGNDLSKALEKLANNSTLQETKIGEKKEITVKDKIGSETQIDKITSLKNWKEIFPQGTSEFTDKEKYSSEVNNLMEKIYQDWKKSTLAQNEIELLGERMNEVDIAAAFFSTTAKYSPETKERIIKVRELSKNRLPWTIDSEEKQNIQIIEKACKQLEQQESNKFLFSDVSWKQWLIGFSVLSVLIFVIVWLQKRLFRMF